MGGEIPREYYFSNTPPQPQDDMEAMTVMSGSKSKLEFHVEIVNSSLRLLSFLSNRNYSTFYVSFYNNIRML